MTVIFADFCLVSKIPSVDTSHVYNPVMSMWRFFKTTVLSSERETWEQITLNFWFYYNFFFWKGNLGTSNIICFIFVSGFILQYFQTLILWNLKYLTSLCNHYTLPTWTLPMTIIILLMNFTATKCQRYCQSFSHLQQRLLLLLSFTA